MKHTLTVLILLSCPCALAAADITFILSEQYTDIQETFRYGPEPNELINMTERGHTLLVPHQGAIPIGVVIFFQRGKIEFSPAPPDSGSFDFEAFKRDLAVMHVSTANPLDFFFDDTTMDWAAGNIQETLESHDMNGIPLFFAGLSLGGTRALRFAAYLNQSDNYWLRASGIALVDAPIDMDRFWYAERNAVKRNFHAAAAGEGRWVSYLLEKNLGGNPKDAYAAYVEYSPYTYSAPDGGNAKKFVNIPIRAYHEPDINWWIENRRKSYYSMNSIDLAGFINQLKILGNEDAELVTTWQQREGFAENLSPHTWSFVDNANLAEWFAHLCKK